MQVPVLILVLLFSVIVHECAHGLAAERRGDPTARLAGRLTLNPLVHIDPVGTILVPLVLALLPGGLLFGWAKPVPVDRSRLRDPDRDGALVAAAGPASNLLLATASALALGVLAAVGGRPADAPADLGESAHAFLFLLLQHGVVINALLAVFNLLPVPPLDGSWIAALLLRGRALAFYLDLRRYGMLLLILLLGTGLRGFLSEAVGQVSGLFFGLAHLVLRVLR